jgi:hypothetical protein
LRKALGLLVRESGLRDLPAPPVKKGQEGKTLHLEHDISGLLSLGRGCLQAVLGLVEIATHQVGSPEIEASPVVDDGISRFLGSGQCSLSVF